MKSLKLLVLALTVFLGQGAFALEVGDSAPCVVLDHIQNGQQSSHCIREPQVEGKPVLLEFFSIACSDCQKNLPNILALAKSLEGKATVRLVSIDRNVDEVIEYINNNQIDLEVAFDTNRFARKAYEVASTPTLFLLDQQNVIQDKHTNVLNNKDIEDIIQKVEGL